VNGATGQKPMSREQSSLPSIRRKGTGARHVLREAFRRLPGAGPALRARSRLRQGGFLLVEAAVAIGIVGTATLATLGFISASAATVAHNSAETTAAWVAASQAEYIGQMPFIPTPGQYDAVPAPVGFIVSNATAAYPDGDGAIQTVTITVSYQGSQVLSTEIVKVDR